MAVSGFGDDPDLASALPRIPDFSTLSRETLPAFRKLVDPEPRHPPPAGINVEIISIPGKRGAPEVSARLYRRVSRKVSSPAILHLHGGGFVMGSARKNDRAIFALVEDHDAVILSVEYRLAPEHPFPAGIEDCEAAFHWLHLKATMLGIAPDCIAIHGESAGGALAASLALRNLSGERLPVALLSLLYPMLDDRTGEIRGADFPVWPASANQFAWRSYLAGLAQTELARMAAAPARCCNLSGLPPTFLAVGSRDLFAREDIEFCNQLLKDGVPAELHVYAGAWHGFDQIKHSATAQRFLADQSRAFSRAFGSAFTKGKG